LLVTEEIAESSDLRATPFEFERDKRVEAVLSILEGKWKIVVLNRLHILHVDTTFLIHNSFHPRKTVQEQRLPGNTPDEWVCSQSGNANLFQGLAARSERRISSLQAPNDSVTKKPSHSVTHDRQGYSP
jgi:hypothetical protein